MANADTRDRRLLDRKVLRGALNAEQLAKAIGTLPDLADQVQRPSAEEAASFREALVTERVERAQRIERFLREPRRPEPPPVPAFPLEPEA